MGALPGSRLTQEENGAARVDDYRRVDGDAVRVVGDAETHPQPESQQRGVGAAVGCDVAPHERVAVGLGEEHRSSPGCGHVEEPAAVVTPEVAVGDRLVEIESVEFAVAGEVVERQRFCRRQPYKRLGCRAAGRFEGLESVQPAFAHEVEVFAADQVLCYEIVHIYAVFSPRVMMRSQ